MKVLYVGSPYTADGYGQAAIGYVQALASAGVDVVFRPLFLGGNKEVNPAFAPFIDKSADGCDICVQHTLPTYFEPSDDFALNVGMWASETSHFRRSGWARRINQMDLGVVFNQQMVGAARRSGVVIPLEVVGHACDLRRFMGMPRPDQNLLALKREGFFLFYTIGEFIRRKNLGDLLKAYFLEFTRDDNVALVVKASLPSGSPEDGKKRWDELVKTYATGLKISERKLPFTVYIGQRLSDEQILSLHATCDTFVSVSHGEAASLPTIDALAMGKTPIVSRFGGFLQYVNEETGWLIYGTDTPVLGEEHYTDLFCGDEEWFSPNIYHLRKSLREVWENPSMRQEKIKKSFQRVRQFSTEVIGGQLKKVLSNALRKALARRSEGVPAGVG